MDKAPTSPMPDDRSPEQIIDSILRVDQAGEYGAVRIYQGQLAVFGRNHPMSDTILHMKEQEDVHLKRFNELICERATRPTLLSPLWHVAGFALGATTAMLGEKAAMACTEAVETVINEHYTNQVSALSVAEPALSQELEKFRKEELDHRDTAIEYGAKDAPGYEILSGLIRFGCKAAIKISERL